MKLIYIKKLQEMLPELKKKYPIKYMGVFGSYVRGEQSPSSDLDILVEFNGSITLLGCAGLENELSDRLGIKVDLVSKTSLKPRIGKHVLSEVVEV
ncbi:nucleotidyltransferase [Methanosarcina siciliae T4/M]|uniref:protein adenylyltransferase n=2 Tax=Methanosarcina siciliae TaxID=38027 RepID=A0A0E3PDR8_9EURY|nr:nucleotidyltransferase family protein [Methanosarcina siciliae]AKB28764.1 nucleotidyltransferase [Methanosarcina siciliae T4/M]AKB32687.1 nucleotidyltransferase [Methanosarcina siciliae HI350]